MSNVLKHLFHVKIVFRSKKICLTYDGKNANEKRCLHVHVCIMRCERQRRCTTFIPEWFRRNLIRPVDGVMILLAEIYRMTFALIFNSGRVKYSSPKRSSARLTCVLLYLYK